jgi:phosphate transport system substrate-binding protein
MLNLRMNSTLKGIIGIMLDKLAECVIFFNTDLTPSWPALNSDCVLCRRDMHLFARRIEMVTIMSGIGRRIGIGLALICLAWGNVAGAADSIAITGAGATFPYPLYSKWFYDYSNSHPGLKFNYQSIGSGGGVKQITAGTVDFGASDAPMTEDELAKLPGPIFHIPTAIGAVAVVYNLQGIGGGLKLTPDALVDIYFGKITRWNDPRIASLNPAARLPAADIVVAHRSDGSGTTDIFTNYLSAVSTEWRAKIGRGKSINWPVEIGRAHV